MAARVSTIEKWVAVADICRCLHNYNAVLDITSAFNRSAIFRLKKTWMKVSKPVSASGTPLPKLRNWDRGLCHRGLSIHACSPVFLEMRS